MSWLLSLQTMCYAYGMYTIKEFQSEYADDDKCLSEVMRLRRITACPECGGVLHRVAGRRCYECQHGHQIYPTKGTVFEKTTTPLSSWFYVIYLMTATRSGVSAKEVERQLGVTYKCAWRMCHQIRLLMGQSPDKLGGHVEIDETYVGGKREGVGHGSKKGKTVVMGIAERGASP